MPELPDVEGYRRMLAVSLPGATVRDVLVLDAGVLRNTTGDQFRRRFVGACFREPNRRGKWLILPTDGPTLLIHNGMTGRPYFLPSEPSTTNSLSADPSDRLVIRTDHGDLRYADRRKLRGVWILDHHADLAMVIGAQGPDAFGLTAAGLRSALGRRRGAIKTVLMDQRVIAGLGNMLSDEILWRAQIHPTRTVRSLDPDELRRLHEQLRWTLQASVKQGEIPRTRSWLNSARAADRASCPRCGSLLSRTSVGGRTSVWCARCQPPDPSRDGPSPL